MFAFISWYLILSALGWLTFPLVYRLFPALTDRGFSLARTAGLLVWGYIFWLLTSLGLTQNNVGGILFGLLVLFGLVFSGFFFPRPGSENLKSEILNWLKRNLRLVVTVEILFLVAFALLALLRAGNPDLSGTERPMELMFINSILRSPAFPPHDSWLSGYAISYYYFGYVLAAMLAKLTSVPGSAAHNLMTSLIFALAAVGAYGILYNLLSILPRAQGTGDQLEGEPETLNHKLPTGLAFLGPLFLLLVSNLEAFLDVLHERGLFWPSNLPSAAFNFWTWLDIKDLSDPPTQPYGWLPSRYLWWWRASRVVSDTDLLHHAQEIIDEFPFFSFLLGDLHPHVLAIPFNLLAVATALNLFLGGWRGETNLFGLRLRISRTGFLAAGLILGGLAFLNTWDILIAAALVVLAYVLYRVREDRWSWARLEDVFILGLPLGILAIFLYLPFYVGFSSQAGGILPNLINPTRGAQLWVMFAPMFVPLLAFLIYLWRAEKQPAKWLLSLILVSGLIVSLWALSWLLGWLAFLKDTSFVQQYLTSQGVPDLDSFFNAALVRRLTYIGGLLSMLVILVPALAFLITTLRSQTGNEIQITILDGPPSTGYQPLPFVLLLIVLGALLVIAPEFVFIRDQFNYRINTIFKFYYQTWLLWSLAAAFGAAVLLQNLRGVREWVFRIGFSLLLLASLVYPALSIVTKTNNFNPPYGWTLDDFTRIQHENPDEAAAITWLKSAPEGVVAEAVGPFGGSYTGYARISEYTGLPAVLGWGGHESQWRGGSAEQGTRENDIMTLYATPKWQPALDILRQYDIRYVYIGGLERSSYTVQEDKFQRNLIQVFQQGNVTIYEIP
jgi:YYY domain-containing protein